MDKKTFYITTPIYFPNDKLHIGHSYTTVAADTIARYKKARGFDVKFLTGTDEHGQKIERTAIANGVTPKEYVDKIIVWIKELWETMEVEYDYFIRTTDGFHEDAVQKIFKMLYDKGDIYKGYYEGLYCAPCESFFTEHQLVNGKCPDCGRDVEVVQEETYFFKLSKYQDRLIKYFEENPDFIKPKSRMNEMMNNFLKPGLDDISVSRTSFKWGVPVDFDPEHVIYVWIDALSNYITALGYLSDDDSEYKKYWPADIHLMAKEIIRFHSIIWPAILMALELPLPKQIYAHGWILLDGGKMSKSKGNIVDPKFLIDRYGVDSIRYFLMRDIVFGQDGNFSNEALISRINSDLANDLGNLLSRTVGMIDKYFEGGILPASQKGTEYDTALIEFAKKTVEKTEAHLDKLEINDALAEIWAFISRNNKYIDETMPWVLAKDESKKEELAGIMYNLSESLRIISILISPFMPNTPKEIWKQLNINDEKIKEWDSTKTFGLLNKEVKITKGDIVFPRIDIKKEMEELDIIIEKRQKSEGKAPDTKKEERSEKPKDIITIDDFSKLDLKVGEVLKCEKLEGSDKLLISQIKVGDEVRQIVSGIAEHYTPDEMIGKKVIVVANLKPVKLRGTLSEGMILAGTTKDGKVRLATIDGEIEPGMEVR